MSLPRSRHFVRRPGLRDLKLSCAHCGHDKFRIHVSPIRLAGVSPGAQCKEIVCDRCERYWELDEGQINSSGHVVADGNPMKEAG